MFQILLILAETKAKRLKLQASQKQGKTVDISGEYLVFS